VSSSTTEGLAPSPPDPPARTSWTGRIVLGVLGALIVAGLAWARIHSSAGPGGPGGGPGGRGGEAAPAPVRTVHPTRQDVPIHLEGLGTLTALETAIVRPRVSGALERLLFVEGQDVHAGDVLAELDPRPFRVALAQAQAVLARDEASLSAARTLRDRDRQLHEHDLLSLQDLQAQEAAVATLEATERADRAAVDAARLNLAYARVVAPIDGRTGIRQVDPGNLVSSSDANGLVVITRIDPIAVIFTLPQDELGAVAARMAEGPLTVEVRSRDGATALATGRLTVVDNRIDTATGTLRLKAEIPNPERRLWPNQLALVRMQLEVRQGVLTVPDAAVQQGPDGPFVYVVVDHHAETRPVQIERTVGDLVILTGGVSTDDDVVSEGHARLRPHAEVRLEGEAPPEGAAGGPRGARPEGAPTTGGGPGRGRP
jgi:multidrug efflux system membrane fusion protein